MFVNKETTYLLTYRCIRRGNKVMNLLVQGWLCTDTRCAERERLLMNVICMLCLVISSKMWNPMIL